jgi:hypothetical protein
MLAPTRELVSALNQRARDHRLAGSTPGQEVELADGNAASVGDLIITRRNDRRLRFTATDWVKNGDRWTILNLSRTGGVRVRQVRSGRTVTLPADYVSTATELGYATTVHTAQGVTADTMHGVVTGEECREQLYTMLTRGRSANHVYLSVVWDGDPHSLLRPDTLHPRTATELLEQILARASPQSATTLQREQQDSAARLGAATARYLDALHLAAEHLAGPEAVVGLDQSADRLFNGLTQEPAWPTLRGRLLLLAAVGTDPVAELNTAAAQRDLTSAHDQAAVIDSRIEDTGLVAAKGPLPWLPGIPDLIAADPNWGPYLNARSHLIAELAGQIRTNAAADAPAWAAKRHAPVPAELIADVQVWRAATHVDPSDLRPTGPLQLGRGAQVWQLQLHKRLAAADSQPDWQWRQLLAAEVPKTIADPFLPELTERLSNLTRAGFDASLLVRSAAAAGPLPDDHPAAALWWRILDQLPPLAPNQEPATRGALPAPRQTTTKSIDQQPSRPHSAPPSPFGFSR